jgi:hypothetical protein
MQSRHRLANSLIALAIYFALSLTFFARMLPGHLFDYYLGRDTDPSLYIWSIAWWPYVLQHHVHPFFTELIWAPNGLNLAWVTCLPLLGIIAAPLTRALGPLATFNLVALAALPLSAFAAYLLCAKFSKSFVAALLGGLVFGFSPYMLAQLLSHMILVLVFPIPLAVYLVIRRLEGSLNRIWFVTLLAITLSAQFLLELEPFALMVMTGGCAILIAVWSGSNEIRKRLLLLTTEIGAACTLTTLLMAPYIYFLFAYGFTTHPLWSSAIYSADLLNFIVPTRANAIGNIAGLGKISANFTGNIFEQGACIGIPLIVVAIVWGRRHWDELTAKILLGTLLVICVFSLGPFLQIGGRPIFPMPWLLLGKLPLLKSALPVRLMVFAFVPLALVFTLWFSDPMTGGAERLVGVVATLAMLMPNPAAAFWASPAPVPEFFRDGSSRRLLSQNDIVLPLPYGQRGMCMLWQAESGMNFRMASGLTGIQPIEIRRWPIINVFLGSRDLPEPDLQLKAFIANLGITAIVVDSRDQHAARWRQMLSSLAIAPQEIGGVLLYRIPPDALKAYRGMNAIELEQRAERARFEALVAATDRYIGDGGDLRALSIPTLQAAGLFPTGWAFDPGDNGYCDMWAGQIDGRIAFGVVGSASGLRPTLASYGAEAAKVYFPFPRIWPPEKDRQGFLQRFLEPEIAGSTSGESMQLMVMEFERAHLRQLAARVETQPSLSLATAPREVSR